MGKNELIGQLGKYGAIVASIYILSRFGFNIYFDNKKE